jgi:hypothetical protein
VERRSRTLERAAVRRKKIERERDWEGERDGRFAARPHHS